jgi:hypothetical protein
MRSLVALLCIVAGAQAALAHDVPVNPSTCTFDPAGLTAVASGLSATMAAPTPADAMRIVYTVATWTAQLQQPTVAPRAFTAGGTAGTLAFPQAFNARFTASGDLRADDVALEVVLGRVTATVPVTLTTAVATAGGGVATGTPMSADGRLALVGMIPAGALPPPFDASATLLRLGCQANPPPDRDQFAPAPTLASLAGVMSATQGKLRAVLRGGSLTAASLSGAPTILHLAAAGGGTETVEFPGGFAPQGSRLLVAQAADGARLTLRLGTGRAPARLQAVLPGHGTLVPAGTSGAVGIEATLVAGTVTARGRRPFRARGGTLRAGS